MRYSALCINDKSIVGIKGGVLERGGDCRAKDDGKNRKIIIHMQNVPIYICLFSL